MVSSMRWLRFAFLFVALICFSFVVSGSAQEGRRAPQEQRKGAAQRAAQHGEGQRRLRPEIFERPERAEWQKPDEVVKRVGVKPGQVVADIGAGSGYFSRRFARVVGPAGYVFACDIDENMLRYIQNRCREEDIRNIVTVLAAPWSPMLPPNSVDVIFLCDTNHHIEQRVDYYRRLKSVLKPGGRIVIVDFFKRELPVGPPPSHKLAREIVLKEMEEAGYRVLVDDTEFLPYQYYLEFTPADAGSAGGSGADAASN